MNTSMNSVEGGTLHDARIYTSNAFVRYRLKRVPRKNHKGLWSVMGNRNACRAPLRDNFFYRSPSFILFYSYKVQWRPN